MDHQNRTVKIDKLEHITRDRTGVKNRVKYMTEEGIRGRIGDSIRGLAAIKDRIGIRRSIKFKGGKVIEGMD